MLSTLNKAVKQDSVRLKIDVLAKRVETKLLEDPRAALTWESIPLSTYEARLPEIIRSSWVFVIHANANTGAERHPNSIQRMMSYRGSGDIQIWNDERWCSNPLISDTGAPIESRWMSIPTNVWHQAMVTEEDWVIVSFHTVPEDKLIEERPDATDAESTHQRRYVGELKL